MATTSAHTEQLPGRRPVSTTRRSHRDAARRAAFVLTLIGVVMTVTATSAWALWTALGLGTGLASTGDLEPPTSTTARSTGSGTVTVSWAAPTSGVAPAGYTVERLSGSTATPACSTSAATAVSCTDTDVPDGSYTYVVTAVRGSWTARGAASAPVTVTNTVSTSTTVTSSQSPSVVGQTVTYTATVTPSTATGSVTFRAGANVLTCAGGDQTLSAGTATCSVAHSASGSLAITAVYAGAGAFAGSTSDTLTQTVNKADTSTALASSANPSSTGQTVTLTASVTTVAPGAGVPSGTVTFRDGATPISCAGGSQTLNGSGVATCQTSYAASQLTRTLTAAYGGSADHHGSTSASLVQSANKADTTTTLSSSANPSRTGQTVTFTATVTAQAPGAGTPAGAVTFKDGAAVISCNGGTQTLNASGVTSCSTSFKAGQGSSRSITAVYGGNADYNGSTSAALTQDVTRSATSTTLVSSGSPAKTGTTVTYTATVSPIAPGSGTPTGTVTFRDGGTPFACAAGNQTLNASGVATCQVSYAGTGVRSITAVYNNDTDYEPSTSAALSQRVINGNVTGLAFSAVKVGASTVTPTCTGTGTATISCTVPGSGQNSTATADIGFVTTTGTPGVYASDAPTTLTWTATGKNPGPGTITIGAGASATSSGTAVTVQKNGNNSATITVRFTDGANSFTATLTIT